MAFTAKEKGKAKAVESDSGSSDSSSDSESELSSSSSSSEDSLGFGDLHPEKYLELARQSIRARQVEQQSTGIVSLADDDGDNEDEEEDEVIRLENPKDKLKKLPPLNPGKLPQSYFIFGRSHRVPTTVRDLDAEQLTASTLKLSAPAPPLPPPELTKSGAPLTKKERKALKEKTAGPGWFDLPAPSPSDLPRLYREVEALRLRNRLDPKRFYRKDEGEGRGIKALPKHFAIGTIVATNTPFGGSTSDNLTRAERKRTLVDELVDDADARRYAKKKFNELQSKRARPGYRKKKTLRKHKR